MPSLNEILSIGKGGMNVSKALLSVAGKNMANVNTPGYNREILGLKSSPYASLGVQTSGPDRVSNPFLQDSVRSIAGDLGFYQGQLIPLEALEPTVNDLDGTGLGQALTAFNGALQDATANPASSVQRMALIEATEYLAQSFHTSSKLMVDSAEKTRDQAESTADRITALAGDVAELNSEIMVLQSNTTPPNALMNTRDNLLEELSGLISIDTLDTGDGSVSVFIAGGRPLVDHDQASTVKITPSDPPPGTVAAVEIRKPNGQELKAMGQTGGALGGLLEAHNEVIVDAMQALDHLAFTLMNSFNAQHQAGFDMNGAPGGDFFEPLAVESGAAALLSVSANIKDNPEHIAASSTVGGVPGNNENLKLLEDIQNSAGVLNSGKSITEGWFQIQVNVGSAISAAQLGAQTEAASRNQLENLLASEVGVSVDEELITMNQANQAYDAAGALIRAADEMSGVLMSLVR